MKKVRTPSEIQFNLDSTKYESPPLKNPPKLVRQNAFIVPQSRSKTKTMTDMKT